MEIKLNNKKFHKSNYPKIIDIEFNQLYKKENVEIENEIDIDEFFEIYDKLFYNIPIEGEFNSHQYIIQKSTDYTGINQNTEIEDLLLQEINQLRLELLESRQIIDDLTK